MSYEQSMERIADTYALFSEELERRPLELSFTVNAEIDEIAKTMKSGKPLKKRQKEYLKSIYKDLLNDETHGPFKGLCCFCPSCLYFLYKFFYKFIHKRRQITKDYFFFVWILIISASGVFKRRTGQEYYKYNWECAEDLYFKISGNRFLEVSYPNKNPKYKIFNRYKKVLFNAIKLKAELSKYLKEPIDFNKPLRAMSEEDRRLIKRGSNYVVKSKKTLSERDLYRFLHISAKRLRGILPYFRKNGIAWDKKKQIVWLDESKLEFYNLCEDLFREIKEGTSPNRINDLIKKIAIYDEKLKNFLLTIDFDQ